jgi:hypothetical protein
VKLSKAKSKEKILKAAREKATHQTEGVNNMIDS